MASDVSLTVLFADPIEIVSPAIVARQTSSAALHAFSTVLANMLP